MLMVPKNSEISRSAWRSSRVSGWGLGCGGSGAWTGVLVGELVDALKFLLDSFRQHKGIGSVSSAEIRVRQDLVEGERKRDGVFQGLETCGFPYVLFQDHEAEPRSTLFRPFIARQPRSHSILKPFHLRPGSNFSLIRG